MKGDSSHGRSSSETNMPPHRSCTATISFNTPSEHALPFSALFSQPTSIYGAGLGN